QSDQELEETLGEMAARATVSVPDRSSEGRAETPPVRAPESPPIASIADEIPETVALPVVAAAATTPPAAAPADASPAEEATPGGPSEELTPMAEAAEGVAAGEGEAGPPPAEEPPETFDEDLEDEPRS